MTQVPMWLDVSVVTISLASIWLQCWRVWKHGWTFIPGALIVVMALNVAMVLDRRHRPKPLYVGPCYQGMTLPANSYCNGTIVIPAPKYDRHKSAQSPDRRL